MKGKKEEKSEEEKGRTRFLETVNLTQDMSN